MAIERSRSKRKVSGGRYIPNRKSRQYAVVKRPTLTKIGEQKVAKVRVIGGAQKQRLLTVNKISVADPKTKKVTLTVVEDVLENTANRNYTIRDIINKSAIVKTPLGKVKITSRPGQTKTLSGILIE